MPGKNPAVDASRVIGAMGGVYTYCPSTLTYAISPISLLGRNEETKKKLICTFCSLPFACSDTYYSGWHFNAT